MEEEIKVWFIEWFVQVCIYSPVWAEVIQLFVLLGKK